MSLTLREIELRLADLEPNEGFEYIFQLLAAYGHAKSSITRLRNDRGGALNKSDVDGEVLWKGQVFYRFVSDQHGDALLNAFSEADSDSRISKQLPRFLIVRDSSRLLAKDTRTGDSLDIQNDELPAHAAFFAPWAKIEKIAVENVNPVDLKAAARMAKLYVEIVEINEVKNDDQIHALNVFFARLLFCFFAEDTGVFAHGQFSETVGSLTGSEGKEFGEFLNELFIVLDTETGARVDVPKYFQGFGYVNGSLFSERTKTPEFSAKARAIVLECGDLDWSQINPDIFGSMIQAVVHPSHRESLGMHYTSVENIMKVLRPLFLDELEISFAESGESVKELRKLHDRIAAIKVFDPACGSGNFLIIAYKELRRLEHRILQRIHELETGSLMAGMAQTLFPDPRVKLDRFYGIEIDDFAHEIATLSLWLAKHQMNMEFRDMFDRAIPLIPLRDTGKIKCGNATQVDWALICPADSGDEIYVCGNPPYLGSSMQSAEQKQEFVDYFTSKRYPKNLDYISLWFFRGAEYLQNGNAQLAFVSTNSVCQGDHVALMWPRIFDAGVHISFAYQSFAWSNSAKGKAGVTCVIIGLTRTQGARTIYSGQQRREVKNIGPYLTSDPLNSIVFSSRTSLFGLPEMLRGSQPTDGGHLILSPLEAQQLLEDSPTASGFVRRYSGADELLKGSLRYCLWIGDEEVDAAAAIPEIRQRLELVRASRLRGSTTAQAMADRPHRFLQRPHKDTSSIIVPIHSSERRDYIPMGFLGPDTVISNAANAIYDAEPWVFGLIESHMHMTWVRTVAGRLKSDYRYSAVLCYNTFPVPDLSNFDKGLLTQRATAILRSREQFSGRTLSELYDPNKMPSQLRDAHNALDETVDDLYAASSSVASDEERLKRLFEMYVRVAGGAAFEPQQELVLDA